MISIAQIKAARPFLGWEQADLAEKSGVSLPTIQRIENPEFGPGRLRLEIIERLMAALEAGGIELIGADSMKGPSVRLAFSAFDEAKDEAGKSDQMLTAMLGVYR